jgi:predicted ester cyclase
MYYQLNLSKGVPMTIASPVAAATAERLVREQFAIIETGQLELGARNVTADFVNHRAATEPPAARGHGPAALQATAEWLRTVFSNLHFEIHEIAVIGDRAIAWVTLHGTQTGPFVSFDQADGSVANVFPPTGRSFAARQVHWFRIVGDAIAEHDAVRDDLAMAAQVGWFPPRPSYMVRMLLARRRYRKPPMQKT